MELIEFINKYAGQKVDFDGAYGFQCFLKDHFILMADWTYKPIQDVKVGDKVIGYDNKINTVTKLFKNEKEVVHIKTELTDFYVTKDHPFYFADGRFSSVTELVSEKPALFDNEVFTNSGLTDAELLFLGFWLGDGNIAPYSENRTDGIRITYGETKKTFVNELNVTGKERKHHESENAYVSELLKSEHKKLAEIILNFCHGEYKKLPLIFSNRELSLIIRGLIRADGSLHHNSYVITNTSPSLLYSVQAACIKLGYDTKSIRLNKRNSDYIRIKGKLVKSVKPLYRLTLSKNSLHPLKNYAEILETKIDTVYNLETDGTHTYICNNYKVHNCVDLFRQYCHDVLETPHTGAVDGAKDLYLQYENLVKEKEYFKKYKGISGIKAGDIAIWDGTKTNKYGHVAIVLAKDGNNLFVMEQDGYSQKGVEFKKRTGENLLGYLRFRK